MIKRLALLCCILLLPTIAAAATQAADVNHGEWWVGGQLGAVFTPNQDVTFTGPNGQSTSTASSSTSTAGASTAASRLTPRFQLAPLSATTSAGRTKKSGKGISARLWTSNGTNSTTQI